LDGSQDRAAVGPSCIGVDDVPEPSRQVLSVSSGLGFCLRGGRQTIHGGGTILHLAKHPAVHRPLSKGDVIHLEVHDQLLEGVVAAVGASTVSSATAVCTRSSTILVREEVIHVPVVEVASLGLVEGKQREKRREERELSANRERESES
jgi:hypothetical protein